MQDLKRAILRSENLSRKKRKEEAIYQNINKMEKPLRKTAFITLIISSLILVDTWLPSEGDKEQAIRIEKTYQQTIYGKVQQPGSYTSYTTKNFSFRMRKNFLEDSLTIYHSPIFKVITKVGSKNASEAEAYEKEGLYTYPQFFYIIFFISFLMVIGIVKKESVVILTLINGIIMFCVFILMLI